MFQSPGIFSAFVMRVKAGVHLNAVFSSLNIHLMLITRSRFKQSKIPKLITRSYVVGYFVNFLMIFWLYLGRENFSQRIN